VTTTLIERHDWINTVLGMLDASLHLTEEEQAPTLSILRQLFDNLDIPGRGQAAVLPVSVALESDAKLFTDVMAAPRISGFSRPIRAVSQFDEVIPLEAWVQGFVAMICASYPDLNPYERLEARKVFTELLMALGIPERAAQYYPDEIIRAYIETR
jgi:hypothetical protein